MSELQRLKKVINWLIFSELAENETELAKKLGYTKSSFSQIINGKVPLSQKFLNKLSDLDENINSVWINEGKGPMLKNMSIDEVNETLPIYNNVDYKEKYYEALEGYHQVNEENRELRLKIDKQAKELEKLKDTHQKQVQETEKCKKELAKFRKEKNNNAMLPV